MKLETTFEDRQAVLRDYCRQNGHSPRFHMVWQSLDPVKATCACGTSWTVTIDHDALAEHDE